MNLGRPVAALCAALVVSFAASGMAQEIAKIEISPSERKWLVDHPELVVGVDPAWAPVEWRERGRYRGLSQELLDGFARALGVRLKRVPITEWETLQGFTEAHGIDLYTGLAITEKRMKYLRFSPPYATLPVVIIARGPKLVRLYDLKGQTVLMVEGYAVSEFLARDFPEIEFALAASERDALKRLAAGEAEAYLGTRATTAPLIEARYPETLYIAGKTPYHLSLSFSAPKENAILSQLIDKYFAAVAPQVWARLRTKWLPDRSFVERLPPVRLAILGGLVLLFLYAYFVGTRRCERTS